MHGIQAKSGIVLNTLNDCFMSNDMSLNLKKTNMLTSETTTTEAPFQNYKYEFLQDETYFRFLMPEIDTFMKWKTRVKLMLGNTQNLKCSDDGV
jgi:hypothetical protein